MGYVAHIILVNLRPEFGDQARTRQGMLVGSYRFKIAPIPDTTCWRNQ